MATNFPGGVDSFTNPTSGDTLASPDHAGQHADVNDAVEAIETALLDGAPLFIDDTNERVGIGTTSPATNVHISAGSSGVTTQNTAARLIIEDSAQAGMAINTTNTGVGFIRFVDPDSGIAGGFSYNHSTDVLAFRADGSDRMVIDSSGNVGIGTTSPSAKLNVVGDAVLGGSLTTEGVDGGAVVRNWQTGSGYVMFGTANMTDNEYSVLTNGSHTYLSAGTGMSVYIRGGNNSTTAQIQVSPSSTTVTGDLSVTGRMYTDLIGAYGGDALGIGAGETSNVMSGNLAGEHLWLGAEGSTYIVTSPDNWSSGWAGRYQTTLTPQSSGTLRVQSSYGYVDIGPNNAGYCHFYTDRPDFYFNSWIMPDGGVRTYDLGTAAAPTLSFRSDTDTGVYRYTTNQLGLTAGNNTGCIVASGTIITASPATSTTSGYQYVLRNNTFGTLYRFSSKRELKEQIATLDDAGSIIDALRPVTFVPAFQPGPTTPDDQDDEFDPTVETDEQRALREADLQYGFIADEIAEVAGGKLAQWEWTDTGLEPAGWKWPDMIAVLVAEVKALRSRIATLEGVTA